PKRLLQRGAPPRVEPSARGGGQSGGQRLTDDRVRERVPSHLSGVLTDEPRVGRTIERLQDALGRRSRCPSEHTGVELATYHRSEGQEVVHGCRESAGPRG